MALDDNAVQAEKDAAIRAARIHFLRQRAEGAAREQALADGVGVHRRTTPRDGLVLRQALSDQVFDGPHPLPHDLPLDVQVILAARLPVPRHDDLDVQRADASVVRPDVCRPVDGRP